MNVGSEETQTVIKQDTTCKNTNKWSSELKLNFLKIEKRERNQVRG